MPIMKVVLNEQEKRGLHELARRDLRDPRAQILFIIRKELERYGLLMSSGVTSEKEQDKRHE